MRRKENPLIGRACARCGAGFKFRLSLYRKERQFCSRACANAVFRGKNRKIPDATVLAHLYVVKNMSLTQIGAVYKVSHKQVSAALERLGIKRRKHTVAVQCIVSGCTASAVKILNKTNGSRYGTRCHWHLKLHRAKLSREYRRRVKGIPRERWRHAA